MLSKVLQDLKIGSFENSETDLLDFIGELPNQQIQQMKKIDSLEYHLGYQKESAEGIAGWPLESPAEVSGEER